MFAMPLAAQAASYTYINQKAPYKNQNPSMLTALNLPKVGTTFQVRVPSSAVFSHSVLAFGVSNPNLPIPAWSGYLFTSAEIRMQTPWSNKIPMSGSATTMSFAIPDSPELLGVKFYQQVLVHVIYPWAHDYSLSRGGVGVIGK